MRLGSGSWRWTSRNRRVEAELGIDGSNLGYYFCPQMEDWEKEKQDLKKKPHLKLQKDVWVDFLVNPKVVVVAVNIIVQGVHISWAPCSL